uniref:Battenin n=1 Tax=Oncorhynchus mykiss TaxID=8022 RepID=A0A8C7QF95_ONCMY
MRTKTAVYLKTNSRSFYLVKLLGLCNNFAYVVMLSAAHDILKQQGSHNSTSPVRMGGKISRYDCTVLLADILPTLMIKFFAPFFIHSLPYGRYFNHSFLKPYYYVYRIRVHICIPGTGGAGVAGALLYSGLTQAGLSPRNTLLIMLVVPVAMVTSLDLLQYYMCYCQSANINSTASPQVVYFAEYFINQGLLELLYFPNFYLSHAEQYQTLYQVGVLVSRSSLCCVKFRRIWALSLLQCVNAVLLLLSVYYQFLPSAWLVFVIVLYEGLLGGAAYVNTFYFISKEVNRQREFAMVAASVGDSLGIAISGLIAFPVHR